MTFGEYAKYYDLLYKDKNYVAEVDFVLSQFASNSPKIPGTLLDLGCGTGRHALEMSSRGLEVTGVDLSDLMIEMGRKALVDSAICRQPELMTGDARTTRLHKQFDAVTSLFHVMSYQTMEADALAVMRTAKAHLKAGGLFLFDFWYGAGVLTDPPTYREKVMEDADISVLRKATPVHHVESDIVEVHYDITLTQKSSSKVFPLNEVHTMRYWFIPELKHLAQGSGFEPVSCGEWLTTDPLKTSSWNGWMLLRNL